MNSNKILPVENFPFDQFKLLGIDKDAVKKLPQTVLKALQSGNRTSLIQFNDFKVSENSQPITLNAKLSIATDADGKPKLKIHPVNLEANNYLGLTEKEIAHITKDPLNVIPKMVLDKKGELIDSFVSLDTTTNEYIAVKRESIKAPEAINDITLTEQQRNDFKNGKPIQIGKDNYRLDVNSETGLAGKNLINLEFKSGKYNAKNAMLDFVLIASGLAPIVLIEHLAKLIARNVIGNVIDNKKTINELLNADLKKPIANAMKEIAEKAKKGMVVSDNEKNEIVVFNVEEALKQDQVTSVNLQPVQEIAMDSNLRKVVYDNLVKHDELFGPERVKLYELNEKISKNFTGISVTDLKDFVSDLNWRISHETLSDNHSTINFIQKEKDQIEKYIKVRSENLVFDPIKGSTNNVVLPNVRDIKNPFLPTFYDKEFRQNETKLDGLQKSSTIDLNSMPEQEEIQSINQKEKIGEKLNGLQESFDSKGYFSNDEKTKNESLTNEFNETGKNDKIASNDQTKDFLGQDNKPDQDTKSNVARFDEKELNRFILVAENKKLFDNPHLNNLSKNEVNEILKHARMAGDKLQSFAVIDNKALGTDKVNYYYLIKSAGDNAMKNEGTIVRIKDLIDTLLKQPNGGDYIIRSSPNELKEKVNYSPTIRM